jgi:hypothetical protein
MRKGANVEEDVPGQEWEWSEAWQGRTCRWCPPGGRPRTHQRWAARHCQEGRSGATGRAARQRLRGLRQAERGERLGAAVEGKSRCSCPSVLALNRCPYERPIPASSSFLPSAVLTK